MNHLFSLVPDALKDARAIFARRWWLLLVVAGIATLFTLARAPLERTDVVGLLCGLALLIAAIALSAYIFADTMRIEDPSYTLTVGRALVLVLIGIGVALITVVAMLPSLLVTPYGLFGLVIAEIWTLAAEVIVTAKLGYVFFASENDEGAFGYSWRITSGAALLPSLVLAAIYCVGVDILQALIGRAFAHIPLGGVMAITLSYLINLGAAMFFSPWMIRWMRVAESMQTVVPE